MNTTSASVVEYDLPGDARYQDKLYPPPSVIAPALNLTTPELVIAHFTASSLKADGIQVVPDSLQVSSRDGTGRYHIRFECAPGFESAGQLYATIHPRLLDEAHAGQAINGAEACQATPGAWNPMAGFPVNNHDGRCEWRLFLPLGMPMVNHKAVTLLHYPPYVAMQNADYLNNMTLQRWQRLLEQAGIDASEHFLYDCILDVNPIAAPGSGQSEYNNDYFPIMMASVFFDNERDNRNYIRSMLEVLLNPPHNEANPYTLPLLVGGSPLYDPQAPGWFRVRYKEFLPTAPTNPPGNQGIPLANVMQAGAIRINPDSKKLTPYMIANHMIAAGVTGRCTATPGVIPDIRTYEAQDLVAASFLRQYADNPAIDPSDAKRNACREWFGNDDGTGAPQPAPDKMRLLCALAQMDLFFDPVKVQPVYTWEQALQRCDTLTKGTYDPCCTTCGKPS